MSTFAVRQARLRRERASEELRTHDEACSWCDVRRRVRCEEGHRLVRAFWDADYAARAEAGLDATPADDPLPLPDLTASASPEGSQ